MQTEETGIQMSIFDLDTQYTKMSLEPSPQTEERIGELCWRKWLGLQKKESQFLDLRRASGTTVESFWEIPIQSHGESSMLNIGECLRGDEGFVLSQILMGIQQPKSFLTKINNTEKPTIPIPTHLSEILEMNADPKYNLSAKACQGILNRATRRGKNLPKMLEEALKQVILLSPTKTEKDVQGGGKGGLIQEDKATSLRTNNYMTVFQPVTLYQREFGGKVTENAETSPTLETAMGMGGNNQSIISYALFENHSQDGRFNGPLKVSQPISHTFGAGGNNVPLVVQPYRKTAHPKTEDEPQGWEEADVNDTLNIFDNSEMRTPTVVWILRQALSEIQEVRKSLNGEPQVRYIVRRLTPLECTRLQGYPDGWVDIDTYEDSNGKVRKATDSHKYKALGNSIALPSWRWVMKRMAAQYERPATLASLFDGISGFPWLWTQINGKGSVLWTSEIEDFPIAVCKKHFGDEETGAKGDYEQYV